VELSTIHIHLIHRQLDIVQTRLSMGILTFIACPEPLRRSDPVPYNPDTSRFLSGMDGWAIVLSAMPSWSLTIEADASRRRHIDWYRIPLQFVYGNMMQFLIHLLGLVIEDKGITTSQRIPDKGREGISTPRTYLYARRHCEVVIPSLVDHWLQLQEFLSFIIRRFMVHLPRPAAIHMEAMTIHV